MYNSSQKKKEIENKTHTKKASVNLITVYICFIFVLNVLSVQIDFLFETEIQKSVGTFIMYVILFLFLTGMNTRTIFFFQILLFFLSKNI